MSHILNSDTTLRVNSCAEPHYNLLFSTQYGSKQWHHSRLNDKGIYNHEILIAENVPNSALQAFNYHLLFWNVRPKSKPEARSLWDVFHALYEADKEKVEGRWHFICQHYNDKIGVVRL